MAYTELEAKCLLTEAAIDNIITSALVAKSHIVKSFLTGDATVSDKEAERLRESMQMLIVASMTLLEVAGWQLQDFDQLRASVAEETKHSLDEIMHRM